MVTEDIALPVLHGPCQSFSVRREPKKLTLGAYSESDLLFCLVLQLTFLSMADLGLCRGLRVGFLGILEPGGVYVVRIGEGETVGGGG